MTGENALALLREYRGDLNGIEHAILAMFENLNRRVTNLEVLEINKRNRRNQRSQRRTQRRKF